MAFVDSDCVPSSGWLAGLAGHLADPAVAAVAPRVTGVAAHCRSGVAGRYAGAHGGLDLGSSPSRVAPGTRVSYVPTAALLARRAALHSVASGGYVFDPARRVGEDVDLVWRLDAAGWRVRYEPAVEVGHVEPDGWRALWRRRFGYGTSAAPLARAHPAAAAPLVLHPWPALTVAAVLARRPLPAAAAFAASVFSTRRALREAAVPTTGVPRAMATAAGQTWLGVGRYATQFGAPLLLAGAVRGPLGRRLAAVSLLAGPPLAAWRRGHGDLDPVRFGLAHVADEIAYGTGVWAGCLRARSLSPVRPRWARRPVRRAGARTTPGDRARTVMRSSR